KDHGEAEAERGVERAVDQPEQHLAEKRLQGDAEQRDHGRIPWLGSRAIETLPRPLCPRARGWPLPSPLWGGVRGGGRGRRARLIPVRPPPFIPPHKGEGRRRRCASLGTDASRPIGDCSDHYFTSGHPPSFSGRKASAAGMVARSL